jgi:hypothetical protein
LDPVSVGPGIQRLAVELRAVVHLNILARRLRFVPLQAILGPCLAIVDRSSRLNLFAQSCPL